MKLKKLKVAYASQPRKGDVWSRHREVLLPKIQMQGKWLEEIGFHIGDQVEVEYGDGAIHIRPVGQAPCMVCEQAQGYTMEKPQE